MVVSCGADTIFCFDRGCRRFKELTLREHWIVLYATATSSSSISPQYAFSAPLWWPHRPRLAPPTTLLKYGPFPFRILYKRNIYRGAGSTGDRLVVPSVRLSTVGSRAFPVAAAQIWNSLGTGTHRLSPYVSVLQASLENVFTTTIFLSIAL